MRGAGLGIDDGLVVQLELPLLERVGEIALESAPGLLFISEQRVEKLERAAPACFRVIERKIGRLQ